MNFSFYQHSIRVLVIITAHKIAKWFRLNLQTFVIWQEIFIANWCMIAISYVPSCGIQMLKGDGKLQTMRILTYKARFFAAI